MLRWTPQVTLETRPEADRRVVRRFALRRASGRHRRKSARGALGHGYHSPVTSLGQPLRWLWRAAVPAAPFLVGIAPIVALWAANRAEFPATVLVPLSIVVGGIAAGALLIGRGLTGRWAAGAVVAAVILAVVVGHGLQLDLVAALTTTRQAERAAGLIAASSIVLALALVIALAWLARTRRFDGADAARALAVGAIAFMALALASPPDPDANAGGGGEGGAVLHDANPNETPAPPVAVGRPPRDAVAGRLLRDPRRLHPRRRPRRGLSIR